MSLADAILSRTRRPTATVTIDGRRWPGVLTISTSQEYGQGVGSAQIVGREPPVTPKPGMSIRVDWGYNGHTVRGFTGYVVAADRSSYPKRWSLDCRDVLWLAERESQPIQTSPLNDITASDAIAYILQTYAGITRVDLPDIKRPSDSGSSWNLGHLTPVSWEGDTTALAACQEIAATAGYWLYADAGGTVRAQLIERAPSSSPFRVLRKGDAAGATLLVQGAPSRRQDASQVRNRITVRGASTGVEGAQLYDVFTATHALLPGVTSTFEYSTFLLEYEDDVTKVAERIAQVWNRVPNVVTARIKADPRLRVGTTVAIEDGNIGYASAQNFFVYRLQTSIDLTAGRFDQQIVLDGGVGDGGFTLIPPPVAVIAVGALYRETIDGGDQLVEVTVDGSGSYSQSEGEIVSYAWATTGTYGSTPTSATTAKATFIFLASASPVTITLTVTDTSSKTNTATLVLDLATGDGTTPPTTEAWSVAAGAAWELTPDGGATWREHVATTTLVPTVGAGVWPTAALGDAVAHGALASGGTALRQTLDSLGSSPTTLSTAPASITALFVNPRNAARVWRACGPTVYRSLDGGSTWTSWGAPLGGTDVVDLIEDPALNDSVFALAGANLYHATAAGSWGVLYAGPSGATARQLVRSDDGTVTWICYTGTFTGAPFQRVEGAIGVTPTGVTEGRAMALTDAVEPASPRLVAIGDTNLIAVVDALTGSILRESTATYPAGATVQHAAASREIPMVLIADFDSVAAGTGAVQKYLVDADALLTFRNLASGRQAHRVGLVGVTQAISAEIIWLPYGESGAQDRLWRLKAAVFEAITPPQAGWRWRSLRVSPFDADRWLLLGNTDGAWSSGSYGLSGGKLVANGASVSPLWLTTNAGATWTEVSLTGLTAALDPFALWLLSGTGFSVVGDGENGKTKVWRLTTGSPSGAPTAVSGTVPTYPAVAGIADEVVAVEYDASGALRWLSGADVLSSRVGSALGGRIYSADHLPNSRAVVLIVGSGASADLFYSSNYLSAGPTEKVSNTGATYDSTIGTYDQLVSAATHGVYVGKRAGGVLRVVSVDGTPSTSTPIGTGSVGAVTADDQTRSVVGVLTTNMDVYYTNDGATWAFQTKPPDAGTLANTLAIAVRST